MRIATGWLTRSRRLGARRGGALHLIVAMTLVAGSASPASAATKTWNSSVLSGFWNTDGNWTPIGVPLPADVASLTLADGQARTITLDINESVDSLLVNLTGAGSAATTFTNNGNPLSLSSGFIVGTNGRGVFNHAGNLVETTSPILDSIVGQNSGANGTYTMSGVSALLLGRDLYVGAASGSTGTFNQTSGSVAVAGTLRVGNQAGATGSYTLTNSASLIAGGANIGPGGTGSLTIGSSASVKVNNTLAIGAQGTVNLNGGRLWINGYSRAGMLNYTSGTIMLTGSRNIGADATISDIFGGTPTIPFGKTLETVSSPSDSISGLVHVAGGILQPASLLRVGDAVIAHLNITDAGVVSVASAEVGVGNNSSVTLSGAGSLLNISFSLTVGGSAASGSITISPGATVSTGVLGLGANGAINVNGGKLRYDTLTQAAGSSINFNAGEIQLAGNRTIGADSSVQKFFGSSPTIVDGKGLTIEGTATLNEAVTLNGGSFTVSSLANAGNLQLLRGKLTMLNQAVTVGNGGLLGSTLDVPSGLTINALSGITNQSLVRGDGQLGGTFTNTATGELRAEPGKSLTLTGGANVNAGQINLFGGQLEFTAHLTNQAGAFISGNGTLITGSGLTNNGTMNFSGAANVTGDVVNAAGAKIISAGGGPTTFFDDVINLGEIRTSAGAFTTFFGSASGGGSFPGTGTVNFEGDLKPGSSAAAVSFGGNAGLSSTSVVTMELGGTAPGTAYDQLLVTGQLALAGGLTVELLGGFTPSAGQTFNLFDWGALTGTFASITLPTLSGLSWDVSQLYATGTLHVTAAAFLAADFDENGTVNVADLARWKSNAITASGATHMQGDADADGDVDGSDFLVWQRQLGSSSAVPTGAVVPEPHTAVLLLIALAGLRRRSP